MRAPKRTPGGDAVIRRRLRCLFLVTVLLVSPLTAVGVGATPTSGTNQTFHVTQAGQCYEVAPLSESGKTVEEFYDYRNPETDPSSSTYASFGTTEIQQNQVSSLFVYSGPEGYSLGFIHDELDVDKQNAPHGSTITMTFSNMPTGGEWAVRDDNYKDGQQDDNWERSGPTQEVDWKWAPHRTDGGAFRGIAGASITIDPGFNEQADAWGSWKHSEGENRIETWRLLGPDGTVTTLDKTESVTVEQGGCPDTIAPNAALSVSASTVQTGEQVTFDASGSTDADTGISEYRWDFHGDGTVDETSQSATVTHTYSNASEYDATVTVEDGNGNTGEATVTVTVEEQESVAPTAKASASAEMVNVSESVTFDGNASTDDGDVVSYEWSFDDGTTKTGATVSHAFESAGEHTATLTVTDDDGNTDRTTVTVAVRKPETDAPPTARIDAPDWAFMAEGASFSANNSSDDERIVSYEWEFEDGTTESGEEIYRYFNSTGEHTVTLTVTDTAGNTDSATATFEVRKEDLTDPTAELSASKTTANVGESIAFDASNSSDEQSGIESYHWNFDGDKMFEETTESPTNSHAFSAPGEYQVEVMVKDGGSNGLTDVASVNVTVQEADQEPNDTAQPSAAIDAPENVTVGEQFSVDASESTDDTSIVEYDWSFDGDATKTGTTATYAFESAGEHTVALTVTDAAGKTDTATASVTVESSEPPKEEPPKEEPPKDAEPTAAFSAPETATLSEKFRLDGSASSDDDGIVSYEWNFDSQGDPEHTLADQSHVWVVPWKHYGQAGTYDVTLTVVDASGQTDSVTKTVTVEQTDHAKPDATIDAPDTVTVGEQFEVRATDLSETKLAHVCWVFATDGHGTEHGPEGTTAEWSFDSTGEKTVMVMLRDRAGNQRLVETTVTVVADSTGDGDESGDSTTPDNSDGHDHDDSTGDDNSEGGLNDESPGESTGGSVPAADPPSDSNDESNAGSPAKRSPVTASYGDDLGEISLAPNGSSDVSVVANATVPRSVTAPTATDDGFTALSYLRISGDAKHATFTVDQDRLAERDAKASAVTLFEFDDGDWSAVETEQLESQGDAYRFRTNESVNGTYAVGLDAPAISVADLSLAETRIDADDATTLTVTLSNDGRANGTFEATLTVGGETVAAKPVAVPAGETREVTFDVSADSPGVYTLGVGEATTSLTVSGIETETTVTTTMRTATTVPEVSETTTTDETTGTIPGFGVAAALLALALAALVAARKR